MTCDSYFTCIIFCSIAGRAMYPIMLFKTWCVKSLKSKNKKSEYSISDINMLGTDLFPLKFPLYNRIFT